MKALLSTHRMQAEPIGALAEIQEREADRADRPMIYQYHLHGELFWRSRPELRVPVKVLIDTGCDITLVAAEVMRRLERAVQAATGELLPLERRILYAGTAQPAYDLAFLLPETGHTVHSPWGFICVARHEWGDGVDMLLGQDLINQWLLTIDGIHGTVTIAVP
jgi:hypothetical protein